MSMDDAHNSFVSQPESFWMTTRRGFNRAMTELFGLLNTSPFFILISNTITPPNPLLGKLLLSVRQQNQFLSDLETNLLLGLPVGNLPENPTARQLYTYIQSLLEERETTLRHLDALPEKTAFFKAYESLGREPELSTEGFFRRERSLLLQYGLTKEIHQEGVFFVGLPPHWQNKGLGKWIEPIREYKHLAQKPGDNMEDIEREEAASKQQSKKQTIIDSPSQRRMELLEGLGIDRGTGLTLEEAREKASLSSQPGPGGGPRAS